MTNYLHDAIVNAELDHISKSTIENITQGYGDYGYMTTIYLKGIMNLFILLVRMFLEFSRRR